MLYDVGRLGAENLLEVTAYTLVLNGRFLRYRDELKNVLVQLSIARGILNELAESAETSRDHVLNTLDLPLTQPGRVVLGPKGSVPADGGSEWDEFTNAFKTVRLRSRFRSSWTGSSPS